MTEKLRSEVADFFHEQTGLTAVTVTQIFFGEFMIEASDGNTYHIG